MQTSYRQQFLNPSCHQALKEQYFTDLPADLAGHESEWFAEWLKRAADPSYSNFEEKFAEFAKRRFALQEKPGDSRINRLIHKNAILAALTGRLNAFEDWKEKHGFTRHILKHTVDKPFAVQRDV